MASLLTIVEETHFGWTEGGFRIVLLADSNPFRSEAAGC
jgi:hypothetical protein